MSKDRDLTLFTPLGKRVKKVVKGSLIAIFILLPIDLFIVQEQCTIKSSKDNTEKIFFPYPCKSSVIISNIYNSLLVSIITLIFIELTLQPDTIKQIKKIFNESRPIKAIKSLYIDKEEYLNIITNKIKNLDDEEEVKFLGSIKDISILANLQNRIQEKIRRGCKFQILLLDPSKKNAMFNCLNNSHDFFKYQDREKIKQELKFLKIIFEKINDNHEDYKGSIELRLLRNAHSPFSYFSSMNSNIPQNFIALIWIYVFEKDTVIYPSIEICNDGIKLFECSEKHFDYLWDNSSDRNLICKYNDNKKTEEVNSYDELLNSKIGFSKIHTKMSTLDQRAVEMGLKEAIDHIYKNTKQEDKKNSQIANENIQEYFLEIIFPMIQDFCVKQEKKQQQNNINRDLPR